MSMLRIIPLLGLLICAGCGVTPGAPANAQGAPNASLSTHTQGPLVISTDHGTYAPTDRIEVTLSNHLPSAVYAYDHQASCSIFGLEVLANGVWQDLDQSDKLLAGCAQKSVTRAVEIAPAQQYQATIFAGYLRQGERAFPKGSYRLRLSYASSPLSSGQLAAGESQFTSVYSSTITVDPTVPPEPLPTDAPSTGGTGTTSGTPVTIMP